jgi:hypothetical protein
MLKDDSTHTMLVRELLSLRTSRQRPWSGGQFPKVDRRRSKPAGRILRDLEPGKRIAIPLSAVQSQTGHLKGESVECMPGRDAPGHCLYGPDYFIAETGTYRVTFAVEMLEDVTDDAVFDLYENLRIKKVLAEGAAFAGCKLEPSKMLLEFFAEGGYRVEFRVYWRGRSPLRVREVWLEKLT